MPAWLAARLTALGLHRWTPWEYKNLIYEGSYVWGRACQWCGAVQNRCTRRGGDD